MRSPALVVAERAAKRQQRAHCRVASTGNDGAVEVSASPVTVPIAIDSTLRNAGGVVRRGILEASAPVSARHCFCSSTP